MKASLATIAVLLLALGWTSEAVQVEENGLSFSLEAVKRLQELTQSGGGGAQSPRLRASSAPLCADAMLPQEQMALCRSSGVFSSPCRISMVPMDVCEICAFAACTGC
uniref:Guanylate cyclase activator 2B n=1 Tax=Gasterosteus aculeatus aculeatus TaxID=481459 RepID=A0AAQ4RQD0_GASAC|nr:guanylin family protein [Gasterosteus aculeatus aculeatus]